MPRWVVVRDPEGKLRAEAFFCTNLEATDVQVLKWFVLRWNEESYIEELRAYLGVATQRQWSDPAIARTTPGLFAMFSIVVLMAIEMLKDKTMPALECAWHKKSEATFSDVIAFVRSHIWMARYFVNSSQSPDFSYFRDDFPDALLDQVCYAT